MNSLPLTGLTLRNSKGQPSCRRAWLAVAAGLLLLATGPGRAQVATVFQDDSFEDDAAGAQPNAPTIGTWTIPVQTTTGATIVTNDVTEGPFSSTNNAYHGTNFLRIQRLDGGENTARVEAVFPAVSMGNTLTATFQFLYVSTGESAPAIQLYQGGTRRVAVIASPDLSGDPYYTPTNFYVYNGDISLSVTSSLPVTPGVWQTVKIEYQSGSTNLTLTVNGTPETLTNAVSPGSVDRIRFNTSNTNTTYSIDGTIKVEATTNTPVNAQILFQDNFQTDIAGTSLVLDDLDPVIGIGDIGGFWDIRDGSTANALPLAVQILNDTRPSSETNGVAGTNNFMRVYRGGSITATGKPYATGWTTANTLDQVVQVDMMVWQEQLATSIGNGVMSVMFGGAPQNSIPTYLSTVGAWIELEATNDGTTNPKLWEFPDNEWLPVRIMANLSSTATQVGLAPQTYSLSINGTNAGTGTFYTTQNTVQSILVAWEGANEHFDYVDDVTIQLVSETLTVQIGTLPDQNKQLIFTGYPGSTYIVQAAPDLVNWTPISTNTADGNGNFTFSDLESTNYTQRYYRGRSQ